MADMSKVGLLLGGGIRHITATQAEVKEVPACVRKYSIHPFILNQTTRVHTLSLKIYKPQVHLDVRNFFFTVRIIDIWNSLPISLINCDTIATFKKHLDCLLKNRGYI